MANKSTETGTVVGAVPYLMVVLGMFLLGFLFLLAIAPLLYHVLSDHHYGSMSDLLTANRDCCWSQLTGPTTGVVAGGVVLLCLIVGFVVQQLSATVAFFFSWLWPRSAGTLFRFRGDEDYELQLALDRGSRLQWEWQFVTYGLSWGIFTNVVLFGIFCALLVDHPSCGWVLGYVGAVVFLLMHSLWGSCRMQLVHNACLKRLRQEEKRNQHDIMGGETPIGA